MVDNNYYFDNIWYFDCLKPLIAAADYELPVWIINELIKAKFGGFPAERSTLENLIVSLLKEPSFDLESCMKLIYDISKIPDVLNNNFILSILRGIRQWKNWSHFKKYCFLHLGSLDAWNELIDWGLEKKEISPTINEVLDCLVTYK